QIPTGQSIQQQVQSGQKLKSRINKPRRRPGYSKRTLPPMPKDKKVLSVRDLMVIGGFVTLLVVAGYFAWQFTQEEEEEPADPDVMAQVGSETEIFELEPEPTLEEQAEAAALESLREIERQQEIERLAKLKEMQEEKEEQEPTNNEPQKDGQLTAGQIEGMFSESFELFQKGKHLEAKEKMAKAYAAFELLENKDTSTRIRYLRRRCNIASQLRENDEAIGFAKEIMVHAGNDDDRLFVSNRLALAYAQKGEFGQAIEHFEQELTLSRKLRGPEHPSVANAYNNLAASYNNQGNTHHNNGEYGIAIEHFRKSMAIKMKTQGPKHPDVISCKRNLAASHHNLGATFQGRGEQEKAIEHFEESLAFRQQIFGPEHIELSGSYSNLGVAYYEKGDHAKAIDYLEKSLAIKMKTLGPDHPQVKQTQNNLANVRAAAKR
ncbi:MAG: tetratricopeptide repeat protein, partial [Opitutales bacterium]